MLEEEIAKIRELRSRIDRYRNSLEQSEALTRYVVIDPFLRLLGWDTENPELVRPEDATEAGRPDYALLKDGRRLAFIGAKRLGRTEDVRQYLTYCMTAGVRYFITTDGAKWEIYDTSLVDKPLSEKKIAEWDLTRDEPGEVLRRAFILFRHSPLMGEAPPPISGVPPSEQIETTHGQTPPTTGGIPLDKVKLKPHEKLTYAAMVFPDGRRYELRKFWYEILVNTVKWLKDTGKLKSNMLPIRAGPKRYLISAEPRHPGGEKFRQPHSLNGWSIECHYSAKNIIRLSRKLLKGFNVNPEEVYLARST